MWLLHTQKRVLEDVAESKLAEYPYCILSHRWSEHPSEEVLFEDIKDPLQQNWKPHTRGYKKLDRSCKLAIKLGYDWIWIDTCCINKASSAVLSESLNSMFRWYAGAGVCIAYLADVGIDVTFETSVWWTRGWTLQELIAPTNLSFYDGDFDFVGTKKELASKVSRITGIDRKYLIDNTAFERASIATRFSWAAHRELGRKEDEAYCLMGLMRVTLPAQYGIGDVAFSQLQRALMEVSDDESLFAWIVPTAPANVAFGMLALSPKWFQHSGKVVAVQTKSRRRNPCRWTQKGVEIQREYGNILSTGKVVHLSIGCAMLDEHNKEHTLQIHLYRVGGQFYRAEVSRWWFSQMGLTEKTVHRSVAGGYLGREETFYVVQPSTATAPVSFDLNQVKQRHNEVKRSQYVSVGVAAISGILVACGLKASYRDRRIAYARDKEQVQQQFLDLTERFSAGSTSGHTETASNASRSAPEYDLGRMFDFLASSSGDGGGGGGLGSNNWDFLFK